MGNELPTTCGPVSPDPYDDNQRAILRNRLVIEFAQRTHTIVKEIDQDIRDRGIAEQTTHRRIKDLFEAVDEIAKPLLEFDIKSAEFHLMRAKVFGLQGENPFSVDREREFLELVRAKARSAARPLGQSHRLRIGKLLRSASPEAYNKLMSDIGSPLGGMAHRVADKICYRVGREYSERRARFEIDMALALASLNPDTPQSGQVETSEGQSSKVPKLPSQKAFQVWQLWNLVGITNQTELAKQMTHEGVPMSQGTVSRLLSQVNEFLKAGGITPPLASPSPRPTAVDPAILDLDQGAPGERHRVRRQRSRRSGE